MYVDLGLKPFLDRQSKQRLLTLMHWQSSAVIIAYNMLREKKWGKEMYGRIRKLFPNLPARHTPSAIIKVAFLFPVLGKWGWVRKRLVPLKVKGTVPMTSFWDNFKHSHVG